MSRTMMPMTMPRVRMPHFHTGRTVIGLVDIGTQEIHLLFQRQTPCPRLGGFVHFIKQAAYIQLNPCSQLPKLPHQSYAILRMWVILHMGNDWNTRSILQRMEDLRFSMYHSQSIASSVTWGKLLGGQPRFPWDNRV